MASLNDYLGADEEILLDTRQHWIIILDDLLRVLALLIVLGGALWGISKAGWLDNTAGDWLTYGVWAGIAIVIARLGWTILAWQREHLYVTTSKVVHLHGVLNRNITGTPLVKVDEVTLHQPWI